MSPKACREYLADMRRRYAAATMAERGRLLDEATAVTGYHRKYAITLLGNEPRPPRKRYRHPLYGPPVRAALVVLWRAADYPWSARLKAMLGLWLPWLRKHTELDAATEAALLRISVRSIDRLLRTKRGEVRRRLYSHTRPGSLLRQTIPIRAERWDVTQPGWSELDTVAHCGGSAAGEFIYSLNLTDIASAWTETRAMCGKGELATVLAIEEIRQSLPFTLVGLDSDSGSEFINYHCVNYCKRHKLDFTRSRPYKKNDNAHIEQKNWTHVRKLFGYQRFEGQATADAMNALYRTELRIWLNYFHPNVKLIAKERFGSRVRKIYDAPQTPLDRLILSNTLSDERKAALLAERAAIDPFALAKVIEHKMAAILAHASAAYPPRTRFGESLGPLNAKAARIQRAAHAGKIVNGMTMPS